MKKEGSLAKRKNIFKKKQVFIEFCPVTRVSIDPACQLIFFQANYRLEF